MVANDRSAVAYQVKVGQGRADDGNATAGKVDERRIDGQRRDRGRRIGTVGRNPVLVHKCESVEMTGTTRLKAKYVLTPTQTLLEMVHALLCPAGQPQPTSLFR